MRRCYSPEQLRDFVDDRLGEREGVALSAHLERCARCRAALERLCAAPDIKGWVLASGPLGGDDPHGSDLEDLIAQLCELPEGGLDPRDGRPSFVDPPARDGDLGTFGAYRILEVLGRGAAGIVLKAHDPEFERIVALKVVRPDSADEVSRLRAARGARLAAGLDHECLARVHSVRLARDRSLVLVMEYVEGPTLREQIRVEGQLSPREAARIAADVAGGLAAAHRAGLVHRDVKPDNILLDAATGRAKLVDFDLARLRERGASVTREGDAAGTTEYMSPEQLFRGKADGRSDLYSLGVTLYESLTGRVPFRGTAPTIMKQLLEDEPLHPRKLDASIPRDLQTICLACLRKEPRRRYRDAESLAADLRRFLGGEPIRQTEPPWWEAGGRWVRRHPLAVAGAVALVVLVLGGLALWHNRSLAVVNRSLRATGQELARAVSREQQAGYSYRIGLAHREWLDNNVGRAAELLAECPEELRAWEWFYLRGLCNAGDMTLKGHPAGMSCVAFSPDGNMIAASGAEGTLRLWDARNGRTLRSFSGSTRSVRCVAFGAGNRLAAGGQDRSIRVWDAATGGLMVHRENAHGGAVNSVAFSPDGRRLASAGAESALRVWDLEAGGKPLVLTGEYGTVSHVVFSPDGRQLAAGCYDGSVRRWDLATGTRLGVPCEHRSSINSVAFDPDGRRLASAADDGTVKLWDATTGQALRTLRGHVGQVSSVAFSPDGRNLASAGLDRAVRVWSVDVDGPPETLRGHTGAIWSVAFSPDGHHIASTGWDGTVRVWDPDADQEARVLDDTGWRLLAVALHPDGRRLASGDHHSFVRLWDAATGRKLAALRGHSRPVCAVAFSPDGRRLASGGDDGIVRLWDPDDGRLLHALGDRSGDVRGLAFSPDGRRLAAAGSQKVITIWDAATGRRLVLKQASHEARSFNSDC